MSKAGSLAISRRSGTFVDLNYLDTVISYARVNTASTPILVNGCSQGSSASNRYGRQAQIKSIQMNFQVLPSTTTIRETIRWMIVHDANPNGVLPGRNDIWALDAGSTVSTLSFRNLDNRERFTILRTGVETVQGGRLVGNSERYDPHEIYIKGDWKTIWNSDTGGTIAAIQTGAIYFLAISSSSDDAQNAEINGSCRIRFTP